MRLRLALLALSSLVVACGGGEPVQLAPQAEKLTIEIEDGTLVAESFQTRLTATD